MKSLRRRLGLATLSGALILSVFPAFAQCQSPGFNPSGSFCNGCSYEGTMLVVRDQACERPYRPRGPIPVEILGHRLIKRAAHGIAGLHGTTFAYAPTKGFVGQDEFTIEVSYRQGTERGKFYVHWTVTVQ